MKVFKDIATKGKSTMEWYIGFNSPEKFFFKFFFKNPTSILFKYVRKKSQTMVKIEFRRDKSLNLIFVRKV